MAVRESIVVTGPELLERLSETEVGRPVVGATDASLLTLVSDPNVAAMLVVMPSSDLTFRRLNELLRASGEGAARLGVLPVASPDHALQDLRRVLQPISRREVALYSDFVHAGTGGLSGRSQVDRWLDLVGGGVGGAVIHSHGNGADMRLSDQVLCARLGLGRMSEYRDVLPCHAGGPCRLDHRPFRAFVRPEAIDADVVVLLSCSGAPVSDAIIDPSATISERLLNTTHAVVASTRLNYLMPAVAAAAAAFLARGGTAGGLANRLNELPTSAQPSYVCLGDPEARLAPTNQTFSIADDVPQCDDRPSQGSGSWTTEMFELAMNAGDLTQNEIRNLRRGTESLSADDRDQADYHLAAVATLLLQRRGPDLHQYFSSRLRLGPERRAGATHWCGCDLFVLDLESVALPSRRLWFCERCGKVAEASSQEEEPPTSRWQETRFVVPVKPGTWVGAAIAPVGRAGGTSFSLFRVGRSGRAVFDIREAGLLRGVHRIACASVRAGELSIAQSPVPWVQ